MDPLRTHQTRIMGLLRDLGATTDLALAARLEELGCGVDRSMIAHWRAGRQRAPLGLLPVILGHLDQADARRLVEALVAPLGLRVELAEGPDGVALLADLTEGLAEAARALRDRDAGEAVEALQRVSERAGGGSAALEGA